MEKIDKQNFDNPELVKNISNSMKLSKIQEKQNQDLVATLSNYWKVAKIEPLRDNLNAHITCVLLNDEKPIAQMDFNAPIDRLHDVFSWNNENLRKFIQDVI